MSGALAGERIGVLGLARSGLAAARLALREGATVYASDATTSPDARAAADELRALGAEAEAGGHDIARLARCDRIVLSPGIPPTAAVLREPALAAVPTVAELEFAWELLGAGVIAVTGTNGKTTVTSLISHLLTTAGIRAPAGGNIGLALSELAAREPQPDWVVVEASSFQLAGTHRFAPAIGVLTNLAPDHLDRYGSVEEYYADKARLFGNATPESRWVLNGEDACALELPGAAPGRRYRFHVASPLPAGALGGWLAEDGWLRLRLAAGTEEPLLTTSELRILGAHNTANALAAALAARLAGAEHGGVVDGLRSFAAPEHRLQPLGEQQGVLWINDSKATNLASTQVALRSVRRPTVLLLGGRHKGEPYDALLAEMGRVRSVVAYGEAAEQIEHDLRGACDLHRVEGGFDEAVAHAARVAHPGDALLLSPACSSFDMFRDYEARGRRFAELARAAE